MEIGKLKNDQLNKWVIKAITPTRQDVLIGPSIGEDCAAIQIDDWACVLTTDPITGSASNIGKLAVDVCVNDIASSGAAPLGILLTLLCPVGTTQGQINEVMAQANTSALALGIDIIGGHTEITDAVNRMVVSATAVGKTPVASLIRTGGASPGDWLYHTKYVGLEGTAILATDYAGRLSKCLTPKELHEAQALIGQTSVLEEGIIGGNIGVSAMHDATEGGVLGAIHELCYASGVGCEVFKRDLRMLPVTHHICAFFAIDPLKLIASGSMIMAVSPEKARLLESALDKQGIVFSRCGVLTSHKETYVMVDEAGNQSPIEMPEADELYKVTEFV